MPNTKLLGTFADTANNDVVSTVGNQTIAGTKTFQNGLISSVLSSYAASLTSAPSSSINVIPFFDAANSGNLGNVSSGSLTFNNITHSSDSGYVVFCTMSDNSGSSTCLAFRGVTYTSSLTSSGFISLGATIAGSTFTGCTIDNNAGKVRVNFTKQLALTSAYFTVYILVMAKNIY